MRRILSEPLTRSLRNENVEVEDEAVEVILTSFTEADGFDENLHTNEGQVNVVVLKEGSMSVRARLSFKRRKIGASSEFRQAT
uniref:Uncharacterized protein n=1 Tax=Vespula pensylvanica TaxID=30213 RepID=A0A834PFR9_VESPE|nr:hypothetical protein H0235_001243 [Vespula pensylvanica]